MNERSGFALIPVGARIAAGILFLAPPMLFVTLFGAIPEAFFGLIFGAMFAGTALLAGYIYGDAPRRGMPRFPWTALGILAPNGIGFLIYFLMRNPLQIREAR